MKQGAAPDVDSWLAGLESCVLATKKLQSKVQLKSPTGVLLPNTSYRPDIDGLRALAVLLVVVCHAGFKTVSGGFIGVDIFFVISGFVVTNSISAALKENRFSFSDFYIRRAKRLIPALFLVMLVTLVFGILFLVPDRAYGILKNIGFVALFSSNIYISGLVGYFDPRAESMPLLHTWSLSVEEQFYFVLPFFLFLLKNQSGQRRFVMTGLVFALSLLASQWAVSQGSSGAYYLFSYRAFEFLVGVLLSIAMPWTLKTASRSNAMLLAGLAVIMASALAFDASTPFPGVLALLPCIGAAAVIIAGHTSPLGQALLGNPVSVAFGRMSYSLYLWHWPVFFVLWHFNFHSTWSALGAIAVSIILAAATYRYVEQPLRQLQLARRRAAVAFIAMPVLLVAGLVGMGKLTDRLIFLYPEKLQTQYKELIAFNGDIERSDFSRVEVPLPVEQALGRPNGARTAALWGDSHSLGFRFFFDQLGKEFDITLYDMSRPGCPPVDFSAPLAVPPASKNDLEGSKECAQNNASVMRYLMARDEIDIVFMTSRWSLSERPWVIYDKGLPAFSSEQVNRELAETIRQLVNSGKKVVLVDGLPEIPESLKDCVLYRDTWFGNPLPCRSPASERLGPYQRHIAPLMASVVTQFPSVSIIRSHEVLCDENWCYTDIGGRQVYRTNDTNHLSISTGAIYYDAYRRKRPGELDAIFGKTGAGDTRRAQHGALRATVVGAN